MAQLDPGSIPRLGRSPREGNGWLPTPVFLPREFHRQRSLPGYSPWGCKELDTTEQLIFSHLEAHGTNHPFNKNQFVVV